MASITKEKYWKYSLIALIALFGWLIVSELWSFVNGLLAAFTVYVLVRRQMVYLTEKRKIHKTLATALILLEVIAVIVLPIYLVSLALIGKIQTINVDISVLIGMIEKFEAYIKDKYNYDLMSADNLTAVTGFLTRAVQYIINQAGGMVITFIVMLFLLYYMLKSYREMELYVHELLPFSDRNRTEVTLEIRNMVYSNAIGIPLMAVIQGVIAYVGYLIFNVPSAFFFALLTCIATIIPLIGTSIIWLPLVVYLAITGDLFDAVGLGIYCAVIVYNIDIVIRFLLQKHLADTHPLITVFGVMLGLYVFGFWGVIFGPLLMSLFFLLVGIFKREYLNSE